MSNEQDSLSELAKRFNQNVNPAIKKALEKETEIPPDWIPQDMDDNLQKLLGCGKYAKDE